MNMLNIPNRCKNILHCQIYSVYLLCKLNTMNTQTNLPFSNALALMTAGNATITAKSVVTGNHFTYKVQKPKINRGKNDVYFVKVLTGNNNQSDYTFFGSIFKKIDGTFEYRHSRNSRITTDAPSVRGFIFILNHLIENRPVSGLELYHEGKCCKCGRKLTTPESIERGIGPECWMNIGHVLNNRNVPKTKEVNVNDLINLVSQKEYRDGVTNITPSYQEGQRLFGDYMNREDEGEISRLYPDLFSNEAVQKAYPGVVGCYGRRMVWMDLIESATYIYQAGQNDDPETDFNVYRAWREAIESGKKYLVMENLS